MEFVKKALVLCFLFCCFMTVLKAEVTTTNWWAAYTYNKKINEEWQLSARLGLRYYSFDKGYYRPDFCPHVQYTPEGNFKFMLGARLLDWNTDKYDLREYRPWIGTSYSHAMFQPLTVSHTIRWEHRFWEDGVVDYNNRLRYRIKLGTTLYKKEEKRLQMAFSPEMFWVFGAYDQATYSITRWGFPLTYRYSKKWQFDISPFLQTNHNGIATMLDDRFWVLQFNIKTFL